MCRMENEMKRIGIILLCISLLTAAVPAFGARTGDNSGDRAGVLQSLGFLWEEYDADGEISRAQLAQAVVGLMGLAAAEAEPYFDDVGYDTRCADSIYAAVNNGVLGFMAGKSFYPERKITGGELLRAVETVLGYNIIRDCSRWENVYALALSEGLLKNAVITKDEAVRGRDAAAVVYNSLTAPRVVVNSYSGEPEYRLSQTDTILDCHNISKLNGIVSATCMTGLNTSSRVGADEVEIDGKKYKTASDFCEYIGCCVEFYSQERDGEYWVLYVSADKNRIVEVNARDITASAMTAVMYSTGGAEKTLKLTADVSVIYNGVCCFDYDADMLMPKNGTVRFTDNDRDGKYETVSIWDYRSFVVDDIRTATLTVTDMNSANTLVLDPDKYEHMLFEKDGRTADFSEIRRRCVIFAYASKDGTALRAVLSTATAEANISGYDAEDRLIYDAEGNEYYCTDEFDMSSIKTGERATLLLGFDRCIAGVYKSGFGDKRPAILLNVREDFEREKTVIKLFTEDNTWANFTAAEKIRLNGERVELAGLLAANALFSNGSYGGVPVMYKLNKAGEISELETAKETKNTDAMRITAEKKYRRFTDYSNSFMPEAKYMDLFADKDTVVFCVPTSAADKYNTDKYRVSGIKYFKSNGYYTVAGYNVSEAMPADIIVCYTDFASEIGDKESFAVVDRVYREVNSLGDVVVSANTYRDGVKRVISSEDMNVFDGLSRGDVIRYSCDLSGNVAYVKPYFRSAAPPKQKQGTESASGSVNITSDFCTVYGRVTDKNEGFITVSLPDNPSDMPAAAVYPTESAWVYLFDSADARVSVVSAGDIEVGDMVFMRSQTTVVRDLIIVR